MKTTLKYNTIETLQRQPAWKAFLDTIVQNCNGLYNDNLLGLDEESNNLVKLSESKKALQTKHANLSYKDDAMHLNLRENASLKGLLRTLSLYGCKIKSIEKNNDALPHTFKVQGSSDNIVYGYEKNNLTYDNEAKGITPDGSTYEEEYNDGEIETGSYAITTNQNYEEENTKYKYIYNLYGYNQKSPVLNKSSLYEVLKFNLYQKTTQVEDLPDFMTCDNGSKVAPNYIYIPVDNYNFTDIYYSNNNTNTGIGRIKISNNGEEQTEQEPVTVESFITDNYSAVTGTYDRFIFSDTSNSAYILNDNEKDDLMNNGVIKYNDTELEVQKFKVSFAINSTAIIEKLELTKVDYLECEAPGSTVQSKSYYIYEDNKHFKKWIIRNEVANYSSIGLNYLKSQLFADECTLKAQPLFLYEDIDTAYKYLSTCANFLDYDNNKEGAEHVSYEGKNIYEFRVSDANKVRTAFTKVDNTSSVDGKSDKFVATGVSYGDYYKVYERFEYLPDAENPDLDKKSFYIDDFYKAKTKYDSYHSYLFDGSNKDWYYNISEDEYKSPIIKRHGYWFEWNNKDQYFETMFFNHFIKVYPVTSNKSEEPFETCQLYCEDLDLVLYSNITAFIVSYDKKGVLKAGSENEYEDLDCSIFSKIISYNKHTHLITVNNPLYFYDYKTPKYVVVAYQNASPFNMVKTLRITAPNQDIKSIVSDILTDYVSENCELDLYTEEEYEEYLKEQEKERIKAENANKVRNLIEVLEAKKNSNYFLFGLYDMSLDKDDVDIKIADNSDNELTATKKAGFFYFPYTAVQTDPAIYVKFVSGDNIVTALYFNYQSSITTSIFDNKFNMFPYLQIVTGFKPRYDTNNSSFFDAFLSNKKSLLYYNIDALAFQKTTLNDYNYSNSMFKNTKVSMVDLSKIMWKDEGDVKVNFEDCFYNCIYLESVNLRLSNKGKFKPISMAYAFYNCKWLQELDLSGFDFSLCTNMEAAFMGCESLERIYIKRGDEIIDIDWGENTVIENMQWAFRGCKKLKTIGDITKWKHDNVASNGIFTDCVALEEINMPNIVLDSDWSKDTGTLYSTSHGSITFANAFTNCGAKRIIVNIKTVSELTSPFVFNMPNLQELNVINPMFSGVIGYNNSDIKLRLETPNLSRESFLNLIRKQCKELPDMCHYGLNIYLDPEAIKRLNINSDIVATVVDAEGEAKQYSFINPPYVPVYIYPNKENDMATLRIITSADTNKIYQIGEESITDLTVALITEKRACDITTLVLYAKGQAVREYSEQEIEAGYEGNIGTYSYTFPEPINRNTQIVAILQDSELTYVTSNIVRCRFDYPSYYGNLTVTGKINSYTYYATPEDLTEANISSLTSGFDIKNIQFDPNDTSYKVYAFAIPQSKAPEGIKAIIDTYNGKNTDVTEKFTRNSVVINESNYWVYTATDKYSYKVRINY